MIGALIILAFTVLVGLVLWLLDRRNRPVRGSEDTGETAKPAVPDAPVKVAPESEGECCGQHVICEKTTLMPLSPEAEYFDDEELDRFAGRAASDYTPEEEEEFREVLYTLRREEVAAWARALTVRNINLPTGVRDELLLIVSELRSE